MSGAYRVRGVRSHGHPTGPARDVYRLTHPGLGFYVDVTVYEREGRFLATADLAEDSRVTSASGTPHDRPSRGMALSEPYTCDVAESVERRGEPFDP